MISALIIDDEASGRKVLSELISMKHPDLRLLPTASTVEEAIAHIDQYKPELIFLDIKMGKKNGFEVLDKTIFKSYHVIFVTAYSEFALQAIKASALDYLLKPVGITELREAIEKFKSRKKEGTQMAEIQGALDSFQSGLKAPDKRLTLLTREGYELIPIQEIIYLKADHNYTQVYLQDKPQHLVTRNLGSFEGQLDSSQFMRIHKSHIVNLTKIRTYVPGNGGFVIMNDGQRFEVSRRKKKELLHLLNIGDQLETDT